MFTKNCKPQKEIFLKIIKSVFNSANVQKNYFMYFIDIKSTCHQSGTPCESDLNCTLFSTWYTIFFPRTLETQDPWDRSKLVPAVKIRNLTTKYQFVWRPTLLLWRNLHDTCSNYSINVSNNPFFHPLCSFLYLLLSYRTL